MNGQKHHMAFDIVNPSANHHLRGNPAGIVPVARSNNSQEQEPQIQPNACDPSPGTLA